MRGLEHLRAQRQRERAQEMRWVGRLQTVATAKTGCNNGCYTTAGCGNRQEGLASANSGNRQEGLRFNEIATTKTSALRSW